MEERILAYRRWMDALLKEEGKREWDKVRTEHLTQLSFFQHERLVHLIVTITFAILELLSVCSFVMAGALASPSAPALGILSIVILILLIPYIRHYYILENEVQKMYKQYDEIVKHMTGE